MTSKLTDEDGKDEEDVPKKALTFSTIKSDF